MKPRVVSFMIGVLTGIMIILLTNLIVPAFAASAPFSVEEKAVAEVIARWDKAYVDIDMVTLASLLTDDAVIESTTLKRTVGKAEYLEGTEKKLKNDRNNLISWSSRIIELKIAVKGECAEVKKWVEISSAGSLTKRWTGTNITEVKLRLEGDLWKIYSQKTRRVTSGN